MRFARGAQVGLLLACWPIFSIGCASLSPKLNVLPSLAKNRADIQYQSALTAERNGQWQKARELYIALQRSSPNSPLYAHRVGVVCTHLKDFETAGKYFEHARQLDPQNPVLLSDMGYSRYLQKDYAAAEEFLSESVRLKPEDPRAVNNLAMAIGFQGRYEESLQTFLRVNSQTQSLLNLAYIHAQKNEQQQAIAVYQRVLSIDSANGIATNALRQLQTTRPGATPLVADATPSQPQEREISDSPVSSIEELAAPVVKSEVPIDSRTSMANDSEPSIPTSPREVDKAFTDPVTELPPEPSEIANSRIIRKEESPTSEINGLASTSENLAPIPDVPGEDLTELDWAKDELAQQPTTKQIDGSARKDDCFRGFCPVALRDDRRLKSSRDEFSAEFQGQTYRFSSAEALIQFKEHPEWYVPMAGGLDVVEFKRSQTVSQGSLDFAVWFRQRLHMFSSAENLAHFRSNPRKFVVNP